MAWAMSAPAPDVSTAVCPEAPAGRVSRKSRTNVGRDMGYQAVEGEGTATGADRGPRAVENRPVARVRPASLALPRRAALAVARHSAGPLTARISRVADRARL